jgi:hypothetical protein
MLRNEVGMKVQPSGRSASMIDREVWYVLKFTHLSVSPAAFAPGFLKTRFHVHPRTEDTSCFTHGR